MKKMTHALSLVCLLSAIPFLSATIPNQEDLIKQADRLEQHQRFQEAIAIYDSEITTFQQRDPRWTAYILFRMANAQYQIGDWTGAKESIDGALLLDNQEPLYKAFQSTLKADMSGVQRSSVYHARRDTGSAKRLVSTNGVLHLFVHGQNTDPWDDNTVKKTRLYIDEADRWIAARALESHLTNAPVFEHRFLTLLDEPFWRRTDVPDADSDLDFREAWASAILARFLATSYTELFDRMFEGIPVTNRSVVFHTSKRDFSIALTPARRIPIDLESAIVSAERSEWLNVYESVAYTHGLLRVYGADELSDKVPDPEIPDSEIMNFGADCLDRCSLGPLTRFAIGWTDQPPTFKRLRVAGVPKQSRPRKGDQR